MPGKEFPGLDLNQTTTYLFGLCPVLAGSLIFTEYLYTFLPPH